MATKSTAFPRSSPILFHPKDEFRESFATLPKHTRFSTHAPENYISEKIYYITKGALTPWTITTVLLGRVFEPLPGHNKDKKLLGVVIRICCVVAFVFLLPIGLAVLLTCGPLHMIGHRGRPYISAIDTSGIATPKPPSKKTLDVRSYNLGFVYDSISIVSDLRPVKQRAAEIVKAFLAEKNSPDIICFQEAFHVEGTRCLCDGLKSKYPYIVYNASPSASGLNSGMIIMSKYPIQEVFFRRFTDMFGPQKLSTRGLLGASIDLGNNRFANVYNAHTQALLGKAGAKTRLNQLRKITQWINTDDKFDQAYRKTKTKIGDFLMGDLNLSLIDAWGNENPHEKEGDRFIKKHFYDPFLVEHNDQGDRIKGSPIFLVPGLSEPTGSWHIGPFANKGVLVRVRELGERVFNRISPGKNIKPLESPVRWGTRAWNKVRAANTARFDYQLMLKKTNVFNVTGIAEIEHVPTKAQSAPSDHLPIRAVYSIP